MINRIKKLALENSYRLGLIDYFTYIEELEKIEDKNGLNTFI